jgi:hypothetical protein
MDESVPPPATDPSPSPPAEALPPPAPDAPPKPRAKSGMPLALVIVIAAVVGTGVWFVESTLVHSIQGVFDPTVALGNQVLDRLTPEAKDRLRTRMTALYGERMKAMSASEAEQESARLTSAGYLRLDDEHHLRRLQLLDQAVLATDTATCATLARVGFAGGSPDAQLAAKVIGNLDPAALEEWIGLSLDAAAAELAQSPPARTVTEDQFDALLERLAGVIPADTLELIGRVSSNPTGSTDQDLCNAIRGLYAGVLAAAPSDAVLFSLYDLGGSTGS